MNHPLPPHQKNGLITLAALLFSLSTLSAQIKVPAAAITAPPEKEKVPLETTPPAPSQESANAPSLPAKAPPAPAKPEKIHLDEKKFALTFPAGWQAPPEGDANLDAQDLTHPLLVRLIYDLDHTKDDGTHPARGSFVVSKSIVEPGQTADLKKIYHRIVASLAPKGIHLLDQEKAKPLTGLVDGKLALFATVPSAFIQKDQTLQPDTPSNLTLYFVLIDCGDRIINLQANIEKPSTDELKESCLKIITSFHELK